MKPQPPSDPIELYWAVRIGDPRCHHLYFACFGGNNNAAALFATRKEAQSHLVTLPALSHAKVVRVVLRPLGKD